MTRLSRATRATSSLQSDAKPPERPTRAGQSKASHTRSKARTANAVASCVDGLNPTSKQISHRNRPTADHSAKLPINRARPVLQAERREVRWRPGAKDIDWLKCTSSSFITDSRSSSGLPHASSGALQHLWGQASASTHDTAPSAFWTWNSQGVDCN